MFPNEFDPSTSTALATAHASLLLSAGVLPESLEGAVVEVDGTPVFDVNGEVLFTRSQTRSEVSRSYLDIGVHPAIGALLVAVGDGDWSPDELLSRAVTAFERQAPNPRFDETRFVAYSYPKIGVQFLAEGQEVGLLELATWIPVLPGERDGAEPPSNFERWSYVDELPDEVRSEHERSYGIALRDLGEILTVLGRDPFVIHRIDISQLLRVHLTRELHFGRGDTGHQVCFELHGQQTSLWCVAASVQMVLDFYRYEYSQERLARELGLGTPTHPSGLPYTNDGDVVTVLEAMTGNALDATMYKSNSFARFRSEIRSNRPLISFVPGHSRVVAGFSETWGEVLTEPTQGLLVYDPWPPGAGVVTRWENFASQVYRRTFTARVTLS